MGTVTSVPAGHSLEIIVDFSPGAGVNQAMDAWGAKLMARYGKDRSRAASDVTTTHLGYSTDNGAYYYYCAFAARILPKTRSRRGHSRRVATRTFRGDESR